LEETSELKKTKFAIRAHNNDHESKFLLPAALFGMLLKEARIMNQELREHKKKFYFKKSRMIFIFTIPLLLASSFLLLPHNAVADDRGQTKYHNISVSAIVPPKPPDFQFSLSSPYPPTIQHDTQQLYEITYGTYKSAQVTTSPTITLDWSRALDPNGAQVFTYMPGTASKGYGGAEPVVDLINHTITWTISSFPYDLTDQKLYAEFQTTGNYVKFTPFNFTMSATMHNEYITMPEQTITQTYYYNLPPGTPGPTAIPTPIPPTPPPPPPPGPAYVTNIAFTGVSDKTATVEITTDEPAKLTVTYGTYITKLLKTVSTNAYSMDSKINLTGLIPDTQYYLRIQTRNRLGISYTSEFFTFQSAKHLFTQPLGNNIIVVSNNNNILLSNYQQQINGMTPYLVLTPHNTYQVAYRLTTPLRLKTIEVVVRNNVLGANTFTQTVAAPPETAIPMQELKPQFYIANLTTLNPGSYDIFVRVADTNGNIVQQKIADLKVIPFLSVLQKGTGKPVSDARVDISYYDMQSRQYKPLNPALFGSITNPDYTNTNGTTATTLPLGRYRINVSALFYDPRTVDFVIGPDNKQQFPVVYLKYNPFNMLALFTNIIFYISYLNDTGVKTLSVIAASDRSFDILGVLITGASVVLAFLLFSIRSKITFKHLPHFALFHWHMMLQRHKQKFYFGGVTNEEHLPLDRVQIDIEDARTKNILTQVSTSAAGRFYIKNDYVHDLNLIFVKPGYSPAIVAIQKNKQIPERGLAVVLTKGHIDNPKKLTKLLTGFEDAVGLFFETSLVISLILEVLFFSVFGFAETLPFFILSCINIILWIFYLREHFLMQGE
jgi:hypothetical protein